MVSISCYKTCSLLIVLVELVSWLPGYCSLNRSLAVSRVRMPSATLSHAASAKAKALEISAQSVIMMIPNSGIVSIGLAILTF